MRTATLVGAPVRRAGGRIAGAPSSASRRLLAAAVQTPRRRAPSAAQQQPPRAARGALRVTALLDYVASLSDDGVLRMPARAELDPDEIKSVFGYARRVNEHYYLGKVIGAGSFGTVREAKEASTGRMYAIKTVSKLPKRGPPTPRCAALGVVGCDIRPLSGLPAAAARSA
jgi:hypothetical protein